MRSLRSVGALALADVAFAFQQRASALATGRVDASESGVSAALNTVRRATE